jgi:hypothetical protein
LFCDKNKKAELPIMGNSAGWLSILLAMGWLAVILQVEIYQI